MSNYIAAYPIGVTRDPALKQFLEAFYAATDSSREEDIERYGNAFTEDAIQEIGAHVSVKGRAEIVAANQGVQANYERQHTVEKVFPGMFNGKDELMLYGFAKVRAREDGAESVVDFAGHIQLVKQNGELKISKYCMHLTPRKNR
ncbi:hypothetical protein FIBSPDRAFT_869505 [Athelia psychrophila]|uniref:SnoaL-like domain-containing protein n=1 Tax=Athelia psychrophila TaxID=1759441 RepID=A0A166C1Q5_9AGAM|nr:hypothetical protein FIBSPDRAFT_869505 [Fibularhizoctonia sp. CBS 109695]